MAADNARARPSSFFELVRTAKKPVLVDFWAEWCMPCRMVSPVVERIAKELSGRITTVKVNVDKSPAVAGHYDVSSIPTIMLFSNGEPVMRVQGAQPYEELKRQIDQHLTS
jgi:thioredoxin 1